MKTSSHLLFPKVCFWLLVAVEVTLFAPIKVNTYIIALLAIFWIAYIILVPGKMSIGYEFWLFFSLFFLFLFGLSYSENINQGLRELEKRSALVVLPLILFTNKIQTDRKQLTKLLLIFFNTGLLAGVGLIVVAFVRYFGGEGRSVFFYKELTEVIQLHPVYFSYYIIFGLLARFLILYEEKYRSYYFWISNLFCVFILILLASKMVLALLFINTLFLIVTHFKSVPAAKKATVWIIGLLMIISAAFMVTEIRERVSEILSMSISDLRQERYAYNYPFNGLSLRLVVWKLSVVHLYNDGLLWLGVGTGDATDYLNKVYAEHGLLDGGYINHNAHNEYVQILLTLGLPGLLYLLFLYAYGFYKGITERNLFLLIFILIFAISSWSESLLTVNKGIVFFSFFYPVLLLMSRK